MTYDRNPNDPTNPPPPADDTDVVEQQVPPPPPPPPAAYTPPPPPAQATYTPPPAQTSNVNVADTGTGYVSTGPGALYYARRVVSLLFGILFVLLIVRIVLLLLVANPGNDIVDFVYSVTEPFVAPFRGIFQFDQVVSGDATLDIAAIVALIGWLLIYLLIMAILRIGDRSAQA
jgi:uncharacterized protein YggT (Ycf19 family)